MVVLTPFFVSIFTNRLRFSGLDGSKLRSSTWLSGMRLTCAASGFTRPGKQLRLLRGIVHAVDHRIFKRYAPSGFVIIGFAFAEKLVHAAAAVGPA